MASKKTGPLCVVTIGYQRLLMPVAVGMKVVQLLGDAHECDWDYHDDHGATYVVGDQVEVSFKTVKHSQIRLRDTPAVKKPLLLEAP